MALNGDMRHLTSEQIQEFLDGGLSPREEAVVREHLSGCSHCQSELEEWSLLFSELEGLPQVEPDPGFTRAVMSRIETRRPLGARVRGWLEERMPGAPRPEAHLPPERIQDYLDGLLPRRHAAGTGAHLEVCDGCREKVKGWERVFGALESLDRLAPSAGFSARVMARVRIPTPAPARWGARAAGRALAGIRTALPRTRKGWAVAGGVASAPTITMAALIYLVFSNSIITLESLATYSYWKASAVLTGLFTLVKDGLLESATLFRLYSLAEAAAVSPLLLGAGGLVFSLLSAGALWVLHRNLIVAPSDDGYARAQI